ncbi:hypothetical protein JOM56_014113 [Amanita muscaria]
MHVGASSGSGKVKADQWRTLGTIYLPVAMALLWPTPDDDYRKLLDTTFSLLLAITTACSHVTSSTHADNYREYMKEYIEGLKELFPDLDLLPNHHMAQHLHEYIIQYGPVHSWWTFPFERLIGIIQRIPNNGKYGEFEETIAKAYMRAANFRGVLSRATNSDALKHCLTILQRYVEPQDRGTLVMDTKQFDSAHPLSLETEGGLESYGHQLIADRQEYSSKGQKVPDNICTAIQRDLGGHAPTKATFLARTTIGGITYTKASLHAGNANVLVIGEGDEIARPGKIAEILRLSQQQTVIIVQYHLQLPDSIYNPFDKYPMFQTNIWDDNLGHLHAINTNQVVSHFAKLCTTWQERRVIFAIGLSRVVNIHITRPSHQEEEEYML